MGALFAITALVMLWLILSRPEAEKDWRDQAEGLRQRLERDGNDAQSAKHWLQLVREKE
jgi:hypothetical protein